MRTEILKSVYSAKHNCNLILKRNLGEDSSVLSLVKHKNGVETPYLEKTIDLLPNGESIVTRSSLVAENGDSFVPSTTIILKDNRVRDFLIHKGNGDNICASVKNGKVCSTALDETTMLRGSGITKSGTTPMAQRLLNLISKVFPQKL